MVRSVWQVDGVWVCECASVDSVSPVFLAGRPWEYVDSWAVRRPATRRHGTRFNESSWIIAGKDALDTATSNAMANSPMLLGTYFQSCMVLSGVVDGPIKGGLPKAVELVGAIGVWCICECSSSRALGAQSAVGAGLTQLVLFWFAGGGV